MNGWRMASMLGLFSSALLASEPAASPETELSLELLEFLGEYGNAEGELELPDDFDQALNEPTDELDMGDDKATTPAPPTPPRKTMAAENTR